LETVETRTDREARWWREWFEADYSWDGLSRRLISGGGANGERTLQDYWRRDPRGGRRLTDAALVKRGLLVEFDGQRWHIAHLPVRSRDGAHSNWKAEPSHENWAVLDALINERLEVALSTEGRFEFHRYKPVDQDGRARFDGAVLRLQSSNFRRDSGRLLSICCDRSCIVSSNLPLSDFDLGASFSRAIWMDVAAFPSSIFRGGALFDYGVFLSGLNIIQCEVHGTIGFYNSIFFDVVEFDNSNFVGEVKIQSSEFHFHVSFSSAEFHKRLWMDSCNLLEGGDFDFAKFRGVADFENVKFSEFASFTSARFSATALFFQVTASHGIGFHEAKFSDLAGFSDASFLGDAMFGGAIFEGEARFLNADFAANARFNGAVFSKVANFNKATFRGEVSMADVQFHRAVDFSGAAFERLCHISGSFGPDVAARFDNAVFKALARFEAAIAKPEASFARAFYAARFLDVADFSRAVAPGEAGRLAAAFVETQFEKGLILTDGSDLSARRYFRRAMLPAPAGPVSARDDRLRDLEAGCRTVKIAMGKARDEVREQRYYRFQLSARQMRSDIDAWERVFGAVYGRVSDFGSSLWRPLAGVLLLTVVCGWLYAVWGASLANGRFTLAVGRDYAFEGQGVALTALKPFSTIEPSRPARPVGEVAASASLVSVLTANPAVTLGLRVATAVQVVFSTLLVFLFGLAVKRRFQIG
jgi:uncharacterized protein YjbI with pentapeptide repeats